MTEEQLVFYNLAVALAIGLLIGVERGWHEREAREGTRIAGLRTFALMGLLGGGSALLAERLGPWVLGLAFLGLTLTLVTAHVATLRRGDADVGITSLVAGLLTFVLAALAALGEAEVAAAAAVVATLLLSAKEQLHRWVGALEAKELRAAIELLLISVVVLPILPNTGYGPWQALNPYTIWWMVVLIASISFAGYVAVKIAGAQRGVAYTGLFGGLASSTALTLHFARLARSGGSTASTLAMGILLACGTMFPRMLLVAGIVSPPLARLLVVPAAVMAFLTYLPALWYWRRGTDRSQDTAALLNNPLGLKTAVSFGLLLALIMLLGKALQVWFGEAGVLVLAGAAGITDVDAITLSLARLTHGDLPLRVAAMGVVIAAVVNSLTKGAMAAVIGGRAVGLRAALPLLIAAAGGLIATGWWVWGG